MNERTKKGEGNVKERTKTGEKCVKEKSRNEFPLTVPPGERANMGAISSSCTLNLGATNQEDERRMEGKNEGKKESYKSAGKRKWKQRGSE